MSHNTYTIYSMATGDILRIFSGPIEVLMLNLASTEGYVEGRGDSATQMVVDGQLVSKPESVLAAADAARVLSNALTQRQSLLIAADWTDTLSARDRLGETLYQQWQDYRQALRDITSQPGFPVGIVWPTAP
jgi:hypothetical protein